jgi:hypothetical protein
VRPSPAVPITMSGSAAPAAMPGSRRRSSQENTATSCAPYGQQCGVLFTPQTLLASVAHAGYSCHTRCRAWGPKQVSSERSRRPVHPPLQNPRRTAGPFAVVQVVAPESGSHDPPKAVADGRGGSNASGGNTNETNYGINKRCGDVAGDVLLDAGCLGTCRRR